MKISQINFLIIGPQKAGTTWIYEYLKKSKNVCLPEGVKETFFWDKYFDKGINWYFSHFKNCNKNKIIGEIGPTYFANINVAERVSKYFPNTKIIITLRNPYERSWSLYLHQLRYGFVKGSFEEAVKQDFSIIDSSLYSKHIKNWYNFFDRKNVLILSYNKLKENPDEFIQEIFKFLEIPIFYEEELFLRKINKSELPKNFYIAKISNLLAHKLREYKFYFVIEFAKKLGLKKIIFGGNKNLPKPSKKELDIMDSYFRKDLEELKNIINIEMEEFNRESYEEKLFKK